MTSLLALPKRLAHVLLHAAIDFVIKRPRLRDRMLDGLAYFPKIRSGLFGLQQAREPGDLGRPSTPAQSHQPATSVDFRAELSPEDRSRMTPHALSIYQALAQALSRQLRGRP